MTVLTAPQIKTYAANAGFTGQALNQITAIALAESGGDTNAANTSDPSGGSYGLVQINGAHFHSGGTSQTCALDPQCAMAYAFELYQSQGFQPWGSYTNGSAANFLPTAEQSPLGAIPVPGHTQIPGYISPSTPPSGGSSNPLSALGQWISDPLRLFKLVAGVVLVALSLLFLVVPGAIDKTTSTVNQFKKAIPGL